MVKDKPVRGKNYTIPITAIPNSPLCPVQAYTNMITLVPANERSPAFVYFNKKGKLKAITHQLFTATLDVRFGLNLTPDTGLDVCVC